MPKIPDGMALVETTIPKSWREKIDKVYKRNLKVSRRQFLRSLIYEKLKEEGEL